MNSIKRVYKLKKKEKLIIKKEDFDESLKEDSKQIGKDIISKTKKENKNIKDKK